ncbi:8388_t:CDS:2 [Ambispora gerdemannii]|uniref:8388_t:CDS:1 n=1 Tax=Ambispora gerdemannii TaxID=144530 RepID=A0A9N8VC10_9GLOM|nr:8388_t:CDS:2 [Ambispora gerdemannii]
MSSSVINCDKAFLNSQTPSLIFLRVVGIQVYQRQNLTHKLPSVITKSGVAEAATIPITTKKIKQQQQLTNNVDSVNNNGDKGNNSLASSSTTKKNKHTHTRHCSMQQPFALIPDDNMSGVIQHPPEICVDYLSHEWKKEDDIWTSWKMMSKQKKEIVNGVRLENASWRTWAKQKYHLKTVNPERLNWMKDSDVTWLYGPFHTAWTPRKHEESLKSKAPTIQDKLGLMHHTPGACQKSCLKKKSISEILLSNTSDRSYPTLVPSHSDSQLYKKKKSRVGKEDSNTLLSTSISETSPLFTLMQRNGEQHIRFNDQVEQCIAVDSAEEDDDNLEKNYYDDESGDNSSDDGAILMKNSRKNGKECYTIHKLAPIPLKSDQMHIHHTNNYCNKSRTKNSTRSGSSSSSSTATTSSSSTNQSKNNSSPSTRSISNTTESAAAATTVTTNNTISNSTSPSSNFSFNDYVSYDNYSSSATSSLLHHHQWDDNDELDVDGLFDMGIFTTDMFDRFDPSSSLYGSSPNSTSPSMLPSSKSDSSSRSTGKGGRGDSNEQDEDGDGFVGKAVHLATGVRDIVHWCSNMVFNGQVF